jgi:hypothetical protein
MKLDLLTCALALAATAGRTAWAGAFRQRVNEARGVAGS